MPPPPTPLARDARTVRTRVWDLPTRLFHWLLALSVTGVLATGLTGVMEWHFRLGYGVLALLLFRLVWGFVGGRWSRFGSFVHGPRSILACLRGQAPAGHMIGHSPLGALSVFAMLSLLSLQVASGLLSDDAVTYAGPLSHTVSSATASVATSWHATYGKWIVISLVVVHLLALAYYALVRRQRLIGPMVSGDKALPMHPVVMPSRDDAASRLLALALFAACAGVALWIGSLRP